MCDFHLKVKAISHEGHEGLEKLLHFNLLTSYSSRHSWCNVLLDFGCGFAIAEVR